MPLSLSELELLPVPDATREAVAALVDRYRRHRGQYQQAAYKEAHIRGEFIDPFFEALGWDVRNRQGYAPHYRDVVVEDTVEVEGGKRAPDYCFRHGGHPKFYVEAKAPSVNIRDAASPAYQVRRYGWSADLPLCLLTDFEELAVYDCRRKPLPTDKPAVARVGYLTFEQYLEELPFLYSVFAKDAIPKGFFDRFADSARGKRGTQTVDAEFLREIEDWRDQLARALALRNPSLSVHDLNFAVQALVDRLLFLRIAEDRKLEPYEQLRHAAASKDVYAALVGLFQRADDKYNSGLFDFQRDTLSPALLVDAKVLKTIIGRLYYPECPYEFSVLGADILGAVYEQFLGKVIRLTAGHQAKVEEKPEVKKAGGVYYTPTYIVDYIVKHTVGEALNGTVPLPSGGAELQPARRSPSPLRILDPACGSGSFLLGAYDYLLDWRLAQCLAADPAKLARGADPVLVADGQGGWRLSTAERKRLLLDHIFGVDIDPQAVEVAKLNLLLKCLEGETETSLQGQLIRDRALPNIDGNIKCGNSLIGPDYFTARLDYDDDEYRRVNPFDWETQFPEIMKSGGFDCVIGNPPYYKVSGATDPELYAHYSAAYHTAGYKTELYALFAERSLSLVKRGGLHSFIVPNSFLAGVYLRPLRALLAESNTLVELVHLPNVRVFQAAKLDSVVYTVRRSEPDCESRLLLRVADASLAVSESACSRIPWNQWRSSPELELRPVQSGAGDAVWARMEAGSTPLGSVASVHLGLVLATNGLLVNTGNRLHPNPILLGRDIARYGPVAAANWFSYKNDPIVGGTKNPAVYAVGPRLCFQAIRNLQLKRRLIGSVVEANVFTMGTVHNVICRAEHYDCLYLLGLMNSELMNRYYAEHFPEHRIKGKYLEALPIRPIDFADPADVARHDRMVALVQGMLDLNRRLPAAQSPRDRELLERQIADTDRAIDALVYELYDLTPAEIALVEGEG